MKRKILSIFGAVGLALCLTYITRAALPGAEIPAREQCAIEDCRSSVQQAGFPLRGYDISRFEGLNCNAQVTYRDCKTEELKRPFFLLVNFLIYAGALGAIFAVVRKVRLKA